MVCRDFILPEPASYVFFYAVFNLRNLLYIIFFLRNLLYLISLKINYSSRSMDRYMSSRSLIYPANSFSIAEGSRFMWYESKAS